MITRDLLNDAIEFEACQDNGVEGRKKITCKSGN